MTNINGLIITEDLVFKEIVHRLICYSIAGAHLIRIRSYEQLIKMPLENKIDLIVLDDSISDAAYYEFITYLRINKGVLAPIFLFSSVDYIKKQAFDSGVNFFFKKPFEPKEVINQIVLTIQSIAK